MKIEIEIPDERISQRVEDLLVEETVKAIQKEYGSGYYYRKDLKEVIRAAIKENLDDLTDRAVAAAATSIENRGIKKLMEELRS